MSQIENGWSVLAQWVERGEVKMGGLRAGGVKARIQKSLSRMQSLRDDVRENLHLAGMEEMVEWQKLEERGLEIEQRLHEATKDVQANLDDMILRLSKLRSAMF
ncbi:hypothetical protein [Pendulispora albinea]|uniref:Uncharacterized protein n=1 Tax=Pendulispora albinea TaxID=2741071 RepID=A0ABZ2LMQ4_9BACT